MRRIPVQNQEYIGQLYVKKMARSGVLARLEELHTRVTSISNTLQKKISKESSTAVPEALVILEGRASIIKELLEHVFDGYKADPPVVDFVRVQTQLQRQADRSYSLLP